MLILLKKWTKFFKKRAKNKNVIEKSLKYIVKYDILLSGGNK
jgi:hypothetical protein